MENFISQEIIEQFLNGQDDEKYIVHVEYDYKTNKIYKIIQDPEKGKLIKTDYLTPFLWVGDLSDFNFYNKDKNLQKSKIQEYGIIITKLNTYDNNSLENGQKFLVKSTKSYMSLISFFKNGGIDPWSEKYKKYFTILNPIEQFFIQKNKRLFKGYDEYSDIHRLVFDIETTGLNPEEDKIILIGIKDNKGFEKIIFSDDEKQVIIDFFLFIKRISPTIIGGYNSASFDFPFILRRAEILGVDVNKITSLFADIPIKNREKILKLGGEVETFNQYLIWGTNIIDISHSVRRAQAINSEIKSWSLKYITKFLDKEKPNRVYIQGDKISDIYEKNEFYYVNPKTGKYKKIGEKGTENLLTKFPGIYEIWSGSRIVENYLYDDLYETMVVDSSFSESTFLLSKLVPTTYERVSTMGTATLWKLIMLAWSYNNNLAIPERKEKRPFTGGLSRLLSIGYSKNIVKFDYSSLYPSIQLVYDIFPESDVTHVQKSMLKYFRDIRIKYKELASEFEKTDPVLSEKYDRKQLPIKIFINSYFGSLSAPQVFPWGDIDKGESVTCIGRQFLRMMIMFFQKRGYTPLVMDSVEFDTPIYLKDYKGNLHILGISDLFNENSNMLSPDGLRDFEEKDYSVLTKNGWKNINYVYRHETNKPIHKLVTKDRLVTCTSDHSVFQYGKQISPTELKRGSNIDIIEIPKIKTDETITNNKAKIIGYFIANNSTSLIKNHIRFRKYEYKNPEIFTLIDTKLNVLMEIKDLIEKEYGVIVNIRRKSPTAVLYNLEVDDISFSSWFRNNCFTSYNEKKIPHEILNGTIETMKSFISGYYLNDKRNFKFDEPYEITQTSKVCMAGLVFIFKTIGFNFKLSIFKNRPTSMSLMTGTVRKKRYYKIKDNLSNRKSNEIWFNEILENKHQYVYDISTEDGTFVGGVGGILLKNTDGINFEAPENREEHTYIGLGVNNLVKKDQVYKGIQADVAEFNDIFMKGEMGLDIDYYSPATINVSRKNYIIKQIKKGKEKIKLTGNTIKSKKIPEYISDFLDDAFKLLLDNKGLDFIELYYSHVDKIFNKQVPLIKIANKARVKLKVKEYEEYIKKTNKAGILMSRQAHMELILLNNYPANIGETIYYVNNGTKKSQGDVQKVTEYDRKYTKKELQEYQITNGKLPPKQTKININCYMLNEKELENNPEKIGDYNVQRYLANFNKRIEPLLVVFHPDIRDMILIEDPKDRQFFTSKQCNLVKGFPSKEGSQDDINEVMSLSDSEIIFWKLINRDPFFMYPEEQLDLLNPYWIEKNRNIMLKEDCNSTPNKENDVENEDEEIFNLLINEI